MTRWLSRPRVREPSESRSSGWAAAAAVIVTAINLGIAFFGWNSAEAIKKHETEATGKLAAINKVLERGYVLYARAAEREFVDLVAYSPGIELTGPAADQVKASIREDRDGLDLLEKEISPKDKVTTRHLMEGYLALAGGDCKEAIAQFNKYSRNVPIRNYLLAVAYQRCGNREKAIELNNEVRKMPTTRPSDRIRAKSIHNNGHAALVSQQPTEAIGYFKQALKVDPTLYGVHYNLAAAHSLLGYKKETIQDLCRYAQAHDTSVVDEIESDPDRFFDKFRKSLGPNWKSALTAQLARCNG